MTVIADVILVWPGTNASIPAGWVRETSLDNKYPKATADGVNPDVTGGSHTHTHTGATHGHTLNAHSHNVVLSHVQPPSAIASNRADNVGDNHGHNSASIGGTSGGSLQNQVVTWASANQEPPYHEVIFIKPSGSSASIEDDICAFWNEATPPTDFVHCDGGGGTPDLRGKYLKGAATDGDSGGTGGGTSHQHTVTHGHTANTHTHSATSGASDNSGRRGDGGIVGGANVFHTHTVNLSGTAAGVNNFVKTDAGSGDTVEVAYKKLGIVQNTSGGAISATPGLIGLWLGTLANIPGGWLICDGQNDTPDLRSKFIKIITTTGQLGDTGGSNTHSHANISHTHTATGTHSHGGSTSAPSPTLNRDTGGDGYATNTHTHPMESVSSTTAVYASTDLTSGSAVSNQPAYRTVAYIQYVQGYLSDSINISESLAMGFSFVISDSISISEGLEAWPGRELDLVESLSISENLANKTTLSVSDLLSISEAIATESQFEKSLADSMSIADFAGIAYFVEPSDSISIAESGIFILGEKYGEKSEWKFKIKNPSTGNFVANLQNARKRWFVERLNDQTEAGFVLDADDTKCIPAILNLGINELYIYYGDTLKWAGQLVSARKIARGNDIYWEVRAKDWVSLLSKRFCGVESLREFTTTDAGQIAWTLIDETQALANGDFGITEGTIQTSQTRSPTYDKKNILEAIRELSNIGKDGQSNYGFDFEITPLKVFNLYYPYKGTIRNGVVFRYPGNCENFEAFVDSWGIINHEWGLGRHWTGQTAIVSRSDATSQTTYKRREAIKNYRDMSVLAFLQDMVYQDIQWLKDPATVIRFDARVDAKTGINNYNVGDGVSVVCDEFDIDEWLWIYERKIEIGDNDETRVSLVVGN